MKKILVTGGAGFLDSHLCEKLLAKDNHVICLDNLFTGNVENLSNFIRNKNFIDSLIYFNDHSFKESVIFYLIGREMDNLKEKFNYKPTTSVIDGVTKFVKWYKNYYQKS